MKVQEDQQAQFSKFVVEPVDNGKNETTVAPLLLPTEFVLETDQDEALLEAPVIASVENVTPSTFEESKVEMMEPVLPEGADEAVDDTEEAEADEGIEISDEEILDENAEENTTDSQVNLEENSDAELSALSLQLEDAIDIVDIMPVMIDELPILSLSEDVHPELEETFDERASEAPLTVEDVIQSPEDDSLLCELPGMDEPVVVALDEESALLPVAQTEPASETEATVPQTECAPHHVDHWYIPDFVSDWFGW